MIDQIVNWIKRIISLPFRIKIIKKRPEEIILKEERKERIIEKPSIIKTAEEELLSELKKKLAQWKKERYFGTADLEAKIRELELRVKRKSQYVTRNVRDIYEEEKQIVKEAEKKFFVKKPEESPFLIRKPSGKEEKSPFFGRKPSSKEEIEKTAKEGESFFKILLRWNKSRKEKKEIRREESKREKLLREIVKKRKTLEFVKSPFLIRKPSGKEEKSPSLFSRMSRRYNNWLKKLRQERKEKEIQKRFKEEIKKKEEKKKEKEKEKIRTVRIKEYEKSSTSRLGLLSLIKKLVFWKRSGYAGTEKLRAHLEKAGVERYEQERLMKRERKKLRQERKIKKKIIKKKIRELGGEIRKRKIISLMKKLKLWNKEGYYGTEALRDEIKRLKDQSRKI